MNDVDKLLDDPMNFNIVDLNTLTPENWGQLQAKYGQNKAFQHLVILHNNGRDAKLVVPDLKGQPNEAKARRQIV